MMRTEWGFAACIFHQFAHSAYFFQLHQDPVCPNLKSKAIVTGKEKKNIQGNSKTELDLQTSHDL